VEQPPRGAAATDDERTLGELITRESDRLSRLLSEFLDFARVQAARRDRLDLRELVRAAVALAGTHPDRGDDVSVVAELPEEPAILAGDEDLLHRAVFNLVLNACQAVGERGQVVVSLRCVSAAERPAGVPVAATSYAIEVRDDGPGIPVDIQDRLFEPFATTKPGGSGLGLAVVHRAIEAHRGVILVDSDASGTRFTVYLPTEAPAPGAIE
jgi:two-component system sensor histidine kinase PilS (NtrC family)